MPLTIPSGDDVTALADWAELRVLTIDPHGVSTSRLEQLLRGEGSDLAEEELALEDEEEDIELELVDEGRGEREMRLEQLFDEIAFRLRLGPSVYPFEHRDERLIRRDAPGSEAYIFLLTLSSEEAAFRRDRRAHQVESAFDNLALQALCRYLGRNARGVRFARNAHDPTDNATRPQQFTDAIEWLRGQLALARGQQEPPDDERVDHWEDDANAAHPPLNSYKDAGVDVVVWWRFGDDRAGAPVLLAQCTVQIDWSEKTSDISIELWKKWIDFETVPPQTALVIPFAVSRSLEQWANRTITAGVIIDRLRLLELLDELPDAELNQLPDPETRAWVSQELASLA
jgi:hypothetical protein